MIRGLINRIVYLRKKFFSRAYVREGDYGIKYYVIPSSSLDHQVMSRGVLDDWDFLKKLVKFVPENGVVLDIGANAGLLSVLFAKLMVPHGLVYSYEPDPENLQQLRQNLSLNAISNVMVSAAALQDNPSVKELAFNIRRSIDGDGNLNRGLSSLKNINLYKKKTITVEASTVDEQVKNLKIQKIDFIKIDVEGAEFLVLQGATNALGSFHPIIQYEYSNTLDRITNESNTAQSYKLLKHFGYRQFYISNSSHEAEELMQPDLKLPDANVICFYGNKLPAFLNSSHA